jgi:hypothetical protein
VTRADLIAAASDRIMWAGCWLAYQAVTRLPYDSPLAQWLLPYAGFYAYATPESGWRWSRRLTHEG